MKIYELAQQLKLSSRELVPYLKAAGVRKTHHLTPLAAEQVAKIRAAVVRGRSSASSVATIGAEPPLVAFGSLKGGVGKTTLSLCTAELLRTASPRWPVVVVDADVAGTELHWVWNEHSDVKGGRSTYEVTCSLVDLIQERPDCDDTLDAVRKQAGAIAADNSVDRRGLVVPTFAPGSEDGPSALEWKKVLETSSVYVTRNLARVLRALRKCQVAVVVDLPAFDVGFAHYARRAVLDAGGTAYLVSDCDSRTLRATADYLEVNAGGSWRHVVVNGVDDARKPLSDFEAMLQRARGVKQPLNSHFVQPPGPVLVGNAGGVRDATNADRDNDDTELFNAISALLKSARLSKDASQRLRGEV